MQEINYTVFDKVSGLPVSPLTDKLIRSMAEAGDESLSEAFTKAKEAVKKSGVKYFIHKNSTPPEITAMAKGGAFKCQGDYFDDYEEALKFLKE